MKKIADKKQIKLASILGIIGNSFLMIVKFLVGILFGSQAMIADATNSASDIFASIMVFLGNKISTEPADDDHNLGHGKAEYIFSLYIGLAMVIASLLVISTSVENLFIQKFVSSSVLLFIVCGITIFIKASLYIYTKFIYKKNKSVLLSSLYKDHRNDILITLVTFLSIFFARYNIYWVDSIGGILISLYIIYTGLKIMNESYQVLMDKSIDKNSEEIITSIVYNLSNDIKMGKMSSIPIGYKYIIVLTIYVDENMTTREAHDITKILQKEIIEKISRVDRVIIHVNPAKIKNK